MSGSILYPPTRADCEIGIRFIEVSGCLPMCGHGAIGTVTMMIENGLVSPREEGKLAVDALAGRTLASHRRDRRFVDGVRIHNVPSYLAAKRVRIDVPAHFEGSRCPSPPPASG
jgi:4-hydroxyproline epimerase